MSRFKRKKGIIDRRDNTRALLTDTLPSEVPIIFSNDGFYINLIESDSTHHGLKEVVDKIVLNNSQKYTIPFRYKITKDATSLRQLSLPHPAAQFSACQFYRKNETLICYYCSFSDFSIRYPDRVGSSYFFRTALSDKNKYKGSTIDTIYTDKATRNPASYFAYEKHDRLYKFFQSNDFIRQEKKFPVMWFLDVGNCFGSIYTHTISWAVKDIAHSKENVNASAFGNDFDKLMQKMNFNETNGICIGPEVSRIFSEIIFQSVDSEILARAEAKELRNKIHFECRRYVDDYIVFSQNEDIAEQVRRIISDCLLTYNLHLNDAKLERYKRPFQTKKSRIIGEAKKILAEFESALLEQISLGETQIKTPKRLRHSTTTVKSFIQSIKSCCFDREVGYDMIANYVISGLSRTIEELTDDHKKALLIKEPIDPENYVKTFAVLLELIYFMYTVHPTVASSFKVAKATILSCRFFREAIPHRAAFLSELLAAWMSHFIRDFRLRQPQGEKGFVAIECLNILLAMSELEPEQLIDESFLTGNVFDIAHADYFSLISCLFYIKEHTRYENIRTQIENRIRKEVIGGLKILKGSHDAHLVFDILCCPYLDIGLRSDLFRKVRADCSLPQISRADRQVIVAEMETRPWFVQWKSVDLLNMVRKKELSTVY